MICKICNKEVISIKALSQHIRFHNITSKEYYTKYLIIDLDEGICKTCSKETKFKSLSVGYQKFCNLKCSNNNDKVKKTISSYHKNRWKNIDSEELQDIKNKISNTVKDLWNDQNSIYHSKEYRKKLSISQKEIAEKERIKFITGTSKIIEGYDFKVVGNYTNACEPCQFKCKKCGEIFTTIWNYLQQGKQCPKCGHGSKNTSQPEEYLVNYIKSLGIQNIIRNSKSIIKPKELDIFIPDLKIAIEYNGLYWHSEQRLSDSNYHLNKLELCNKKGIHLIQIFEDEWLHKKDVVKERIKNILGKNKSIKIYGRKCIIKEISPKQKNEFLEKFHLQGKDSSVIKLGAFYNNELVSVMTFSKGNISKGSKSKIGVWELNRFCSNSNYHIPGIASKLLTNFKRNYEWKEIFSYADKRWSMGNLYYKIGFELDSKTKPNYWYLSNNKRIHRFNLRKRKDEPKDIPEWKLRQNEGLFRIWDCGSLKFRILNKNKTK